MTAACASEPALDDGHEGLHIGQIHEFLLNIEIRNLQFRHDAALRYEDHAPRGGSPHGRRRPRLHARSVAVALPVVIVAGCLISLLSFGPRSIMGLFLAPMTEARGWSREIFALSIAIQNIMWGIGQPFAGAIADRYGSGRVLAGGGLVYAAGLVVMAWAPDPLWLNVSAGLMIGLGMAAASFSIVLAAFGRRVPPEKRSIVFGIGTAAGSMGQFIFAPFGQTLIQSFRLGRGAADPRRS